MISADFALGFVVKNILLPTHILDILRVDMVVPVIMMFLTRLVLDRFGTLFLYEFLWGLFSVIAMPAAFGLPGFLKMLPSLANGLILDGLMSALRRFPRIRLYVTALAASILSSVVLWLIKVAMGMPWERFTQLLFGYQLVTGAAVWLLGAWLTAGVWERIRRSEPILRIYDFPAD